MAEPMNVLLITTDQMRRDHMGCSGNPIIRTPSLEQVATDPDNDTEVDERVFIE